MVLPTEHWVTLQRAGIFASGPMNLALAGLGGAVRDALNADLRKETNRPFFANVNNARHAFVYAVQNEIGLDDVATAPFPSTPATGVPEHAVAPRP
ncbi:MAG TPA: hypothetical protein VGD56_08115 [Gemmatirosa sp.]